MPHLQAVGIPFNTRITLIHVLSLQITHTKMSDNYSVIYGNPQQCSHALQINAGAIVIPPGMLATLHLLQSFEVMVVVFQDSCLSIPYCIVPNVGIDFPQFSKIWLTVGYNNFNRFIEV